MKLSFSTLGCPEWTFDEILTVAKDLSYQGVEIRGVGSEVYVPRIREFGAKELANTKNKLAALGLSIPCLTSACELHNEDAARDTIFECREYIDTANELGTPYVRILGDRNPEPAASLDEGLVIELAKELGGYAETQNVTLLIETNGYFADSERLKSVLDRIDSPAVRALWDVHHPYRYFNESPEKTFGTLGGYIKNTHFKDSLIQNGKLAYTLCGEGDLPLRDMVRTLKNGGYDGFYSLEWLRRWDLSLEEPGIAFAHYVDYMNDL